MGLLTAFARNKVFANLAMVTLLMAGILSGMVMTRAATSDALYMDISRQFARYGNAVRIVAGRLGLG